MPRHTLALAAWILLAHSTASLAQKKSTRPLMEPYTPTRLEWLALEAQSISHRDFNDGFTLSVRPTGYDTLVIFVRYLPAVKREVMNIAIDAARSVVHALARNHGWHRWVVIKEDVAPGEERTSPSPP